MMEHAVLLIQCPDQHGIISRLSSFVFDYGGNIVQSDQYSTDPDGGLFIMRVEFCWADGSLSTVEMERGLAELATALDAQWEIHYGRTPVRMAIAVSRFDHCLVDLLYRVRHGELPVEIPCVISNHEVCRDMVEREGIPFHHLPMTKETKAAQENQFVQLIRESSDFLVMARYMQILSDDFLRSYGKDVINIHHSFLPSFKGANPYRQAYERGVKIIGATAHYASVDLDEGPIIAQVVDSVTHRDNVDSLKRRGRVLEQAALAEAIHAHVEHRVIRIASKTVVFD